MKKQIIKLVAIVVFFAISFSSTTAFASGYVIAGANGNVTISHNSPIGYQGSGECWKYAREVYNRIWNYYFSNEFHSSDNMLRNLDDDQRKITVENVKNFVGRAKVGSVIRVASARKDTDPDAFAHDGVGTSLKNGGTKYGHNIVIVNKSSSGFTFIENVSPYTDSSGKYHEGTTRECTYDWATFVSQFTSNSKRRDYKYFKYIKYPAATEFSLNTGATDLEFRNVEYPQTYKIGNGWNLKGGKLVTNGTLKTLTVCIKDSQGNSLSSGKINLTANTYAICNLDGQGKDLGQRFSKIKTPGKYYWCMTATDNMNRTVYLEMEINAVSNGSTTTATKSASASGGSSPSYSYTETPLSGVYKFNKNDDSRSGPGESYQKVKDMSKDTIVFVVASALSQYNYTWYKLSDGSFVYSGDVDKVTLTETSMSGQYRFLRDDESRVWPYEASDKVQSYSKGSTITVVAKVVNSYGNTWYKISGGSYVWSGDVEPASGVQELQFSGVKYPTNYKVGSSNGYILSDGTLASNKELKTITTTIKKSNGTVISGPKTRNISGYSYTIKSLDTMESGDNGVKFSKISAAGSYIWVLTATDAGNNTLTMEMPFTASSSATTSGSMSKKLSDVNKPVSSVTITLGENSGSNISATYYGYNEDATCTLYAQVSPTDATNPGISWTSSNVNVLKLSSSENAGDGGTYGRFTRTGVGSTVITATAQDGSGKKATLTYNYYISSIGLEALNNEIYIDQTTSVIPTIVPSVADYQDITWDSSSPWVATVDSNGVVKGVSVGTTVITATAKDNGGKKGTCTITVKAIPVEDVYLSESYISLAPNHAYDLIASFEPYNATNQNVTWSSSDTTIATVDSSGRVTALKDGTAIITVTTVDGGRQADCEVYVPKTVQPQYNMTEGNTRTISISNGDDYVYLSFQPNETGTYAFLSTGSLDTLGYVYDSDWNLLTQDDDGGKNRNFFTKYEMISGQKYYFKTKLYGSVSTGSYSVRVERYKPVESIYVESQTLHPGDSLKYSDSKISCLSYSSGENSYWVASNQGYYFESIDDEICSVTWDGQITAKARGTTYVKVYSRDNPAIMADLCIYVCDEMSFTCNATAKSDGKIRLTINGTGNLNDKISAFSVWHDSSDEFEFLSIETPGYIGDVYNSAENTWAWSNASKGFSPTQTIIVTVMPLKIDELWGTTQSYSFNFSPFFMGRDTNYYILTKSFNVSVSLPEKPDYFSIEEDEKDPVGFSVPGLIKEYKFIPSQTGKYAFYSEGEQNSVGQIFDSNWNLLASDDNSGADMNFFATADMIAGREYYLRTRLSSLSATGKYIVKISKYKPVSTIYSIEGFGYFVGESYAMWVRCRAADGTDSTNQAVYFDPIDNEVCSVSESGYVVSKQNGMTSVVVHSKENPQITSTIPIWVQDNVDFSCNATTKSSGEVILEFRGLGNSNDRYAGMWVGIRENQPRFVSGTIAGYETIVEEENGTAYVYVKSKTNVLPVSQSMKLNFLPDDIEELWGTTKQYRLVFMPVAFFGNNKCTYGTWKEATVTVAFPEAPSPVLSPSFVVPAAVTTIEEEAFRGIGAKRVKLSENVRSIGSKAFADCSYLSIYIPIACEYIARDAFMNSNDVKIYGKTDSYAELYATQYGIEFIPVE